MFRYRLRALVMAKFCFSVLLMAAWVRPASADGGIFPITLGVGYSADQRAILVFDPEAQTETMVLSTMYFGHPADFAWVIPVPNLPSREQVSVWEGGEVAFQELFYRTEPRFVETFRLVTTNGGCASCGGASAPVEPASAFVGVEVVDRLQIKGLDITLLNAQSANDLIGWLNANGYRFPESSVAILEHYVGKRWAFVAVKVDTPDEENRLTPPPLWSGYFPREPLKLTFRTDQLILPMRISAATSRPEGSAILCYVLAPYRVRAKNFPTVEMVPPKGSFSSLSDFRVAYQQAFLKLLDQPQGRGLVVEYAKPSLGQDLPLSLRSLVVPWHLYYLTRLRTVFRPEHMTDDIVFVPNETNDPVDVIIFSPRSHARVWNWLVTVVAATFWFAVRRTQRTAKREALLVGFLTALAIGGL